MTGMTLIGGGTFWMGSDDHYPEERPSRAVVVDPFHIDTTPVTNAQFRAFRNATGYVTLAERKPDAALYPRADPSLLRAGSSVFIGTDGPVDVADPLQWWAYVPGANWKRPEGRRSDLVGREHHPVVHIAFEDAAAYAAWAGKRLPSEAEWEFAARGGLDRAAYAWGDEFAPGGVVMANTWEGDFPWRREPASRHLTSPVGSFPANGYGLFDMIGNVWEWTDDWYGPHPGTSHSGTPTRSCCVPRNPRGAAREDSMEQGDAPSLFARKVLKGGSYLCAASYCRRYRPAARHPHTTDTSTSHIGFRCVRSTTI